MNESSLPQCHFFFVGNPQTFLLSLYKSPKNHYCQNCPVNVNLYFFFGDMLYLC